MNTDMKPFKQGYFSRYCSVYSTLNALQALGLKLKYNEWQELYDHLIFGISCLDVLFDLNANGADYRLLEVVFKYANEWLTTNCNKKFVYYRPFWNKRLTLTEFIDYAKQQSAEGRVTHIRIRSEKIDHYTVIRRITKDKIKFYDSTGLDDILLKNIDTANSQKYQICLRQVYFLSLEAV